VDLRHLVKTLKAQLAFSIRESDALREQNLALEKAEDTWAHKLDVLIDQMMQNQQSNWNFAHEGGSGHGSPPASPRLDFNIIAQLKERAKEQTEEIRRLGKGLSDAQKKNLALQQITLFNQKLEEKMDNDLFLENVRLSEQVKQRDCIIDLLHKEIESLRAIIDDLNKGLAPA